MNFISVKGPELLNMVSCLLNDVQLIIFTSLFPAVSSLFEGVALFIRVLICATLNSCCTVDSRLGFILLLYVFVIRACALLREKCDFGVENSRILFELDCRRPHAALEAQRNDGGVRRRGKGVPGAAIIGKKTRLVNAKILRIKGIDISWLPFGFC